MTSLTGKTALITGSTDGVGRAVATRLGEAGARVLVHGRDQDRGNRVVAEITQSGGAAEFLVADLASLAEVRRFGETVWQRTDRLDILINNAGIGTAGASRQTSADGHEFRFAVNYLAGFLLTHLLFRCSGERAGAHRQRGLGRAAADRFRRHHADARLQRRARLLPEQAGADHVHHRSGRGARRTGVTVNALHPATYMDTAMVRRAGVTPMSSVEEGAEAILKLAASPAVEGRSGCYFNGLHEARAERQAYDTAARRQLRAISQELCAGFGIATAPRVGPG